MDIAAPKGWRGRNSPVVWVRRCRSAVGIRRCRAIVATWRCCARYRPLVVMLVGCWRARSPRPRPGASTLASVTIVHGRARRSPSPRAGRWRRRRCPRHSPSVAIGSQARRTSVPRRRPRRVNAGSLVVLEHLHIIRREQSHRLITPQSPHPPLPVTCIQTFDQIAFHESEITLSLRAVRYNRTPHTPRSHHRPRGLRRRPLTSPPHE